MPYDPKQWPHNQLTESDKFALYIIETSRTTSDTALHLKSVKESRRQFSIEKAAAYNKMVELFEQDQRKATNE